MKRKLSTLCLILALGGLVQAGDTKLDPTGTWKWVAPANPDGQIPKTTFTLRLQGETLTGTRTSSTGTTTTITNGVFKGDEVSFQVLSEGHAGKSTTTYSGKLSGDTIKGKLEIHILSRDRTLSGDWEVKREAGKP
jgi:autotransporter translocation and assembly factor TamB